MGIDTISSVMNQKFQLPFLWQLRLLYSGGGEVEIDPVNVESVQLPGFEFEVEKWRQNGIYDNLIRGLNETANVSITFRDTEGLDITKLMFEIRDRAYNPNTGCYAPPMANSIDIEVDMLDKATLEPVVSFQVAEAVLQRYTPPDKNYGDRSGLYLLTTEFTCKKIEIV